MFRRCVCFLVFITCFKAAIGWADVTGSKTQDISFGTYIQLADNASISWQDAGDCVVNGLYKQTSCLLGIIQFHDPGFLGLRVDKRYHILQSSGTFSGCSINISNVYIHNNNLSISGDVNQWEFVTNNSDTQLSVTADIQINEECNPGTYQGSLSLAYQIYGLAEVISYGSGGLDFKLSITFNSSLSVNQTQEMDFGSIVKNDIGGTVVLSPTNQVAYNGIYAANSATSEGIFAVDGIAGRTVYITLPSEVLLYNENNSTLSVNNFVSNVGNSLTLGGTDISGSGSFNVGATLNIPPNATEGNYSGTYTVTVSY